MLTLALAFGAAGDIALELSFIIGGTLFAIAHLFAIALYLRNRRASLERSQILTAATLILLTPVIVAAITYPLPNWGLATAYTALVGAMAAAAWTSAFPRYRVGIGAILFVASDLMIFAREGGLLDDAGASWAVWPLYYAGQFLIATGVVQTLRARMKLS